jgi:hypothetical protein
MQQNERNWTITYIDTTIFPGDTCSNIYLNQIRQKKLTENNTSQVPDKVIL